MRVLWFSNKPPSGAIGSTGSVGGSWIEALERQLMTNSNIELGIVFNQLKKTPKETKSKTMDTRYFMVPRYPFSKFKRWINRIAIRHPSEKNLPEYLRIVEEFQPNIILFFGTESDFPLIIPELKVPSIIWFQGNLTVYDRMFENGIEVRKTMRFETMKNILMGNTMWHDFLNSKHLVMREKRIFSIAENFIGRTDWDRRIVSALAPQARYFHCDESMRRPFWENRWIQWQDRDTFIITTTIRGNLYKGLETVFEACDLLSQRLEGLVEWRVIGISEGTSYVKAAKRKAKIRSHNSNVKLLGSKSGTELVQELLKADLYVHPSHIENSPNGVQEAMLLGMPVIATNVGGTPSLLIDSHEGLLIQNKDPYAMAGAILELYQAPDKAKRLGENARKRGLRRNDGKKLCSDLLTIFNQMTKSAQRITDPK